MALQTQNPFRLSLAIDSQIIMRHGHAFQRRFAAGALVLLGPLLTVPARGADALPLVAVHDATKDAPSGSVSFLHPETYAVLGTAAVQGDPWPLSYESSGKKLLVLGATPRSAWSGKATGAWALNLVDVASPKNMTLGEVGLPPIRPLLDAVRERFYALGEGAKNEPAVLTVFDLTKNEELARLKTAPGGVGLLLSPSGRRLYVLHGGDIPGRKEPPSRLVVFDTETLEVAAEESLPPRAVAMALGADGAQLYVLARGGKRKEGPAAQGKLLVLDAEAGTVIARLDVGFEARLLTVDRKRGLVYVLGEDAGDGPGWLTVVRRAEIKGRVAVPVDGGGIRFFQDDRPLYVLGDDAIVAVDPEAPSVLRTWRLDFDPAEILFDATRSRAYVAPGAGSDIAEIDLTNGAVLASLKTGRKGKKAGKAIGSALLGAATGVVLYGRGSTAMMLRPDGKFLYAINAYTDDLTIIDTEKQEVVDYISTGGGTWRIAAPPKSAHFYVESTDRLTRISMTDHRVVQEIPLSAEGQPRGSIRFDIPRARVFIPKGKIVEVLDLATGDSVASVRLALPVSVVVEPGRPVKDGQRREGRRKSRRPPPHPRRISNPSQFQRQIRMRLMAPHVIEVFELGSVRTGDRQAVQVI